MEHSTLKNINIGFDMDSVITDWPKKIREVMAKKFPELICPSTIDQKHWDFAQNFPKEYYHEISKIYLTPEPGFYYDMDPIPGAIETIMKLSKMGVQSSIVTSPMPIGKNSDLSYYQGSRKKQVKYWAQICEEKLLWLLDHAPDLEHTFLPLHNKNAYYGRYLVDDRPNAGKGFNHYWEQITFNNGYGWIDPETKNQANWDNNNMIEVIACLESPIAVNDSRVGGC